MTEKDRTYARRFLASLVAMLVVISVLGPAGVGIASAQTVSFTQTVQGSDTTFAPGDTFTVEATVDYGDVNAPAIDATLPPDWTVTSHTDDGGAYGPPQPYWAWQEGDNDGVSGSHTVTYTVQVPSDASPGDYTIGGEGSGINPADSSFVTATDDLTVTVESTGNTAPTVDAIDDQTVISGENIVVPVSASDADGDSVTLSLSQSPGFVTLANGEISIDPASGDAANSPYTVEVTADDGTTTTTESFQVAVETATSTTSGTALARVNAGGSTISATDGGLDWTGVTGTSTDGPLVSVSGTNGNYNDGDAVTVGSAVPSSTPSGVYDAERYGGMTWEFDVAQGNEVEVRLHLSNQFPQADSPGDRQYNVTIEGDQVLNQYDPVQDVGHATGTVKAFTVTSDGTVTINFTKGAIENPQINAIEVVDVGDGGQNTAPTVQSISDQTVTAGTSASVDVSASDADGDSLTLTKTEGPSYVTLVDDGDGTGTLDISPPSDATTGSFTVTVQADDGTDTTAESFQLTVEEPAAQTTSASVAINPGSGVEASTYNGGSYQVTNTGDTDIQTLTLDLSETMLPDMVFDPFNTAGDDVGKEFTLDSGDVTVQNVEYTNFHNGVDNDAGYDTVVVTLSGFEPGETMTFSVDNDPTSIDTTDLGSQAAGPVSGLEITGGTVSVDSGSGPVEATIVGDGSPGGSTATVQEDADESTPSLDVEGVSLSGTTLSDRHAAATVSDAQQTITISGAPANAEVTLLRVEGELNLDDVPTGYDIEEYEANKANQVQYYSVTTDSNGEATVDVTLTDTGAVEESGLNYFTAWVDESDGDTGPISDYAVLQLNAPPTADAGADQTVDEGQTVTLDATGSGDTDGSIASYAWTVTDDAGTGVTLSDTAAAQPTFTVSDVSDDATLTFEVEVTDDDGSTATDTVSVTVQDTDDDGPGPVGDFENAPTDPDGDGVYEDVNGDGDATSADVTALFDNLGGSAVQGNTAAFDVNGDGDVTSADVTTLFVEVTGSDA